MRLKKGIKKGLYNMAMILNCIVFVYCGFFKDLYLIGFIALLNGLYFGAKYEILNEE